MPALQMGDGCGGAALGGKTSQLVSFPRGASTSAVVQCAQQACSEAAKRSGGFVAGMTPSLDHRIGGARSPIFASPKTWHRPAGVEVDPHRFQPWRKPRGGDGRPGNGDAALLAQIRGLELKLQLRESAAGGGPAAADGSLQRPYIDSGSAGRHHKAAWKALGVVD